MKMTSAIPVCLLALGLLAGCAASPYSYITNLHAHSGRNLICLGDSLTAGDGAQPGTAYPDLVSGTVKYPVINAGVSGDTTALALARLEKDVLDKEPRLVIVELGANDYLRSGGSLSAIDQMFDNLTQIVVRIQSRGAVVVLADININEDISNRYKKLARIMGALYIPDILKGVTDQPELMADSFHPNSLGYAKMAGNILNSLRPVLNAMAP
jgi:acyl-CoA thioesterase-1